MHTKSRRFKPLTHPTISVSLKEGIAAFDLDFFFDGEFLRTEKISVFEERFLVGRLSTENTPRIQNPF